MAEDALKPLSVVHPRCPSVHAVAVLACWSALLSIGRFYRRHARVARAANVARTASVIPAGRSPILSPDPRLRYSASKRVESSHRRKAAASPSATARTPSANRAMTPFTERILWPRYSANRRAALLVRATRRDGTDEVPALPETQSAKQSRRAVNTRARPVSDTVANARRLPDCVRTATEASVTLPRANSKGKPHGRPRRSVTGDVKTARTRITTRRGVQQSNSSPKGLATAPESPRDVNATRPVERWHPGGGLSSIDLSLINASRPVGWTFVVRSTSATFFCARFAEAA